MRPSLAILGGLLLIALPLAAQPIHGGLGYFSVGMHFLQLDDLNNRLAQYQIPTFDVPYITLGGGGAFSGKRIFFGGEGAGFIQREQSYQRGDTTFRMQLDGGMGVGLLGFNLLQNPITIQLLGGIGGSTLTLKITEERSDSFDDILQRPQREITLTIGSFLFQGSANVLIPITNSLFVGLQGGYVFSITNSDWQYSSRIAIANGPKAGFDGAFARLLIGFGWFGDEDECGD